MYEVAGRFEEGVYGCGRGSTRTVKLGVVPQCSSEAKTCFGVSQIVLSGAIVAYQYRLLATVEDDWYVVVRDLRTGHVLRRVPTGTPSPPTGNVGVGPILSLVVKPNGSVAWIAEDVRRTMFTPSGALASRYLDVYAADHNGMHLLASGANIDPSSLALGGSFAYWTDGGKPFSTTLN